MAFRHSRSRSRMSTSGQKSTESRSDIQQDGWQLNAMHTRRPGSHSGLARGGGGAAGLSSTAAAAATSDELHAWSIYRQNLNSEFTDSALGSSDKSPLPYGNFQLRETTVNSILAHPKYGARSELGSNMYTYLKYGLPRVFPPGRRDGSSGYDSSDDGSMAAAARERYRRSKSNPELHQDSLRARQPATSSGGDGVVGRPMPMRAFGDSVFRGRKGRCSSEVNLLMSGSTNGGGRHGAVCSPDTLSELGGQSVYTHRVEQRQRRRRRQSSATATTVAAGGGRHSRAESRASFAPHPPALGNVNAASFSRRQRPLVGATDVVDDVADPPMLNEKLFPRDQALDGGKHPHLQLRAVSCEQRDAGGWRRQLENVTFEAHGGDLVGVMSSTESEGTALLDLLADRGGGSWRRRMSGSLVLNGCTVSPSRVASRVAYVQRCCHFTSTMTVRQTLVFSAFLQEPGHLARGFNVKQKISALIDDLGLSQVSGNRIAELTLSELRRLNVACQLCLDTDLLLLDQPTRSMDIFDTFFLVEYLRQWAARGRIVLLTIQPPTYEIFTMLSKVLLLSSQRVIFSGSRREMLPFFAYIDYPCPAYKNPSDYYIDLVTLDDLSPEATLESSQRVEELAETFRQRQEPLPNPGAPGLLPPKIRRANFCLQVLALWIRALVYKFPYNLIRWAIALFLACLLSIIVGLVFYDQRGNNRDQESIPDRLGFHYTMLSLAVWPLLLLTIGDVWLEKNAISRDVADRLYGKFAFVSSKLLYSLPGTVVEGLLLLVPAYKMAGVQPFVDESALYIYVGYMLVYITSAKLLAAAVAHATSSRHAAAGWSAAVLGPLQLVAGWAVQPGELPAWSGGWLRWCSPAAWLQQLLSWHELAGVTSLRCDRNPIVPQDNTIIVQVDCGVLTGRQALRFAGVGDQTDALWALLVTAVVGILALVAGVLAFLLGRQQTRSSRSRGHAQM